MCFSPAHSYNAQPGMWYAEDYAKALEKDKQALKPRRKGHIQLGSDSRAGSLSSGLPESTGLIPSAHTAPTAAYQPYLDGAHVNSRPGTPGETSPSFATHSGQLILHCTLPCNKARAASQFDMPFGQSKDLICSAGPLDATGGQC